MTTPPKTIWVVFDKKFNHLGAYKHKDTAVKDALYFTLFDKETKLCLKKYTLAKPIKSKAKKARA